MCPLVTFTLMRGLAIRLGSSETGCDFVELEDVAGLLGCGPGLLLFSGGSSGSEESSLRGVDARDALSTSSAFSLVLPS